MPSFLALVLLEDTSVVFICNIITNSNIAYILYCLCILCVLPTPTVRRTPHLQIQLFIILRIYTHYASYAYVIIYLHTRHTAIPSSLQPHENKRKPPFSCAAMFFVAGGGPCPCVLIAPLLSLLLLRVRRSIMHSSFTDGL